MVLTGRCRAVADLDHFGDVNEMILDAVSAVETGQLGLLDNPLEIAVVAVAQDPGKVAARPKLHPGIVRALDPLERRQHGSSGISIASLIVEISFRLPDWISNSPSRFFPHAHLHNRHRVIAEDVHHLDRDLAPPRRAFVEDALQFQRAVLLRAEGLPLVLEDVIARPDLLPIRPLSVGFCTRTISRLLSKLKSTAQ